MEGKTTENRFEVFFFDIQIQHDAASGFKDGPRSMTKSSIRCLTWMRRELRTGKRTSRVVDVNTSSIIASPFARSVLPVAVLSRMQSASSGGKTSVAPNVCNTFASSERESIQRCGQVRILGGHYQRSFGQLTIFQDLVRSRDHEATGLSSVSRS